MHKCSNRDTDLSNRSVDPLMVHRITSAQDRCRDSTRSPVVHRLHQILELDRGEADRATSSNMVDFILTVGLPDKALHRLQGPSGKPPALSNLLTGVQMLPVHRVP